MDLRLDLLQGGNEERWQCHAGVLTPSPYAPMWDILATLCRFDSKYRAGSYSGPFIPCERRLANMEIWEIQGRAFRGGF